MRIKARFVTSLCTAFCLLLVLGCRQEMAQQPSYRPLERSSFYPDQRSSRPLVKGTIARGQLKEDAHFFTGRLRLIDWARAAAIVGTSNGPTAVTAVALLRSSSYADAFPFPLTPAVLARGRQRYDIFCSPCHDRAGTGRGMIVQRGFTQPPSFHTDLSRGFRLRGISINLPDVPVGYVFETITAGFGAMPAHAELIPPEDRWAIIAYVRALQVSQQASFADVANEEAKQALLQERP